MDYDNDTTSAVAHAQQAHPWHGVDPQVRDFRLRVFIENVAFDEVKYEVDHATGLMKIDQPLQTSSLPPYAYGFIPRSLCGPQVARMTNRKRGDNSPLDVFVLSERNLRTPGVIADVRLIGGIRVRDENLVDDKLLTILAHDPALSSIDDIDTLPIYMVERISHFLGESSLLGACQIGEPFDRRRAQELLTAALEDYDAR